LESELLREYKIGLLNPSSPAIMKRIFGGHLFDTGGHQLPHHKLGVCNLITTLHNRIEPDRSQSSVVLNYKKSIKATIENRTLTVSGWKSTGCIQNDSSVVFGDGGHWTPIKSKEDHSFDKHKMGTPKQFMHNDWKGDSGLDYPICGGREWFIATRNVILLGEVVNTPNVYKQACADYADRSVLASQDGTTDARTGKSAVAPLINLDDLESDFSSFTQEYPKPECPETP